jgi:glycosyltransferase involved in cell wall biosynthesis
MERPRLLFLSHTLPIPEGGAGIRSYNVLRLLSRHYEITVLAFYRKGMEPASGSMARQLELVRGIADVEVFPIPQEFSRARLIADHLRSVLRRRAYTIFAYGSREFESRVRAHVQSGRYALAHLDSLDLAGYLPLLNGLPIACTHQNIESQLMRRRAALERLWLVRRYMEWQASLLAAQERRCADVSVNLVVSDADAATLRSMVPGARVAVAPNGVDTEFFQPGDLDEGGVVFVGPASWPLNVDAMRFLGEDILPRVRRPGLDVRAVWVGRATPTMKQEFAHQFGINMTGFVADVRPYVWSAACYVVPLRTGGGTRLKILEAWALGKAVVSTSMGCEGLAAVDGENILIRDTAAGFADAVLDVLSDAALRARLGRAGRSTAVHSYDWEMIGRTIAEEYATLHDDLREVTTV